MADSDSHSGSDAPKRPMVAFQRNRQRPVSVEVAADVDATAVPAASSSLSAPPLHQSHALPGRKATLSKLLQAGGARRVKVKRRPLAPSNSAMQDAAPRPVMPWTGAYAAYMQRQSKTKSAADSTVSSEAAVSFTASDETTPSPQLNAQAKQPTSAKVTPTSAGGEPALRKTEEHTVTATGTNSTERLALAHRSSTASATSAHATPEATITRPVATKPAVVTAKVASRPAVLHKTAQPTSRGGSARVRRASLSIALDKHGSPVRPPPKAPLPTSSLSHSRQAASVPGSFATAAVVPTATSLSLSPAVARSSSADVDLRFRALMASFERQSRSTGGESDTTVSVSHEHEDASERTAAASSPAVPEAAPAPATAVGSSPEAALHADAPGDSSAGQPVASTAAKLAEQSSAPAPAPAPAQRKETPPPVSSQLPSARGSTMYTETPASSPLAATTTTSGASQRSHTFGASQRSLSSGAASPVERQRLPGRQGPEQYTARSSQHHPLASATGTPESHRGPPPPRAGATGMRGLLARSGLLDSPLGMTTPSPLPPRAATQQQRRMPLAPGGTHKPSLAELACTPLEGSPAAGCGTDFASSTSTPLSVLAAENVQREAEVRRLEEELREQEKLLSRLALETQADDAGEDCYNYDSPSRQDCSPMPTDTSPAATVANNVTESAVSSPRAVASPPPASQVSVADGALYCAVCSQDFTAQHHLRRHLASAKHRKNAGEHGTPPVRRQRAARSSSTSSTTDDSWMPEDDSASEAEEGDSVVGTAAGTPADAVVPNLKRSLRRKAPCMRSDVASPDLGEEESEEQLEVESVADSAVEAAPMDDSEAGKVEKEEDEAEEAENDSEAEVESEEEEQEEEEEEEEGMDEEQDDEHGVAAAASAQDDSVAATAEEDEAVDSASDEQEASLAEEATSSDADEPCSDEDEDSEAEVPPRNAGAISPVQRQQPATRATRATRKTRAAAKAAVLEMQAAEEEEEEVEEEEDEDEEQEEDASDEEDVVADVSQGESTTLSVSCNDAGGSEPDDMAALLAACGQSEPTTFDAAFGGAAVMDALFKVGEGTFAEVYAAVMPEMPAAWATATDTGEAAMAFKVMPLGGDTHINDEPQKTAAEMMTEVMATVELSRLTTAGAPSFIRALSVSICTGSYPTALLTAWDDWKEANASECENERPDVFAADQQYIVFVFDNGGQHLEGAKMKSLQQAKSIFLQTALGLAAAEEALAFEHRDLHWGNVLLKPTSDKTLAFVVDGETYELPTAGTRASIIDFTLSRLEMPDGPSFFLDLAETEWLFEGSGDIQFDTYRRMQKATSNKWDQFKPKTNVLWLQYLLEKLLHEKQYSAARGGKREKTVRAELEALGRRLKRYRSARALVNGERKHLLA